MTCWRAAVEMDPTDFAYDRVRVLLAESMESTSRMIQPVKVEMSEPVAFGVTVDPRSEPFLTLPTAAAAALFEALARHFLGTTDVVRLNRELKAERARVDALIAGLGRVGGVTS